MHLYHQTTIHRINIVDKSALRDLKKNFDQEAITIVHCMYIASPKFTNGGWVNLFPTTYLYNQVDRSKLPMQNAFNIPIAPNRHEFKHVGDIIRFILYFPPIPKHWKIFNIIEETNSGYGLSACNIERQESGIYQVIIS